MVAAYKLNENGGWTGVANTVLGANAGATVGVGASLIVAIMNNTTLAMVGGPATQLNFGNGGFSVTADQEVVQVNIGTSGGLSSSGLGAGGKYGGNGTFSYFTADTYTLAQVASGTVVTGDTGTDGAVNVNADDTVFLIAVAGAAFKGENLGIGLSGVVNDVTRTTQAIIGTNLDDDATPIVTDPSSGSSTWDVAGPVTVSATEDGDVVSLALSGASLSSSQPVNEAQAPGAAGAVAPDVFGSWGLGISGDGVYNGFTDTTEAYINDSGTFATAGMTVGALDDTELIAATGAFTLPPLTQQAAAQNNNNGAISGSYSENDLHGATQAFIQNAQLTVTGDLSVTANRHNNIVTLACSLAGSPVSAKWAVAGSVAIDYSDADTEAYLEDVSGTVTGSLTVTAEDDSEHYAIGGPVGLSGQAGEGQSSVVGIGLGYGLVRIDNPTITAYVAGTTLGKISDEVGDVDIAATTAILVVAVGVALDFNSGQSKFAVAGNVSENEIEMTVDAYVGDDSEKKGSSIISSGTVTVKATDSSTLISVAGSAAIANQTTAAVGAAVSYNLVHNSVLAYVDDSTVQSGGTMTVSADSNPLLVAVAIGGATADTCALGGSVTINSVANTVAAYIEGSTITTGGDLDVTAAEAAHEVVVAGAFAWTTAATGTGSAAVGAAIAYNYVGQSFDTDNPAVSEHYVTVDGANNASCTAYIDNSTLTVAGNLDVSAGYQPQGTLPSTIPVTIDGQTALTLDIPSSLQGQVVAVAIGGANANTFALGGSLAMSFIRETIDAHISSSKATVTGTVSVTAIDASAIVTVAGGLAYSQNDGGGAIGAAVVTNDIANTVTAEITGSTVQGPQNSASGAVSVISSESANSFALAIAGAQAAKFAIGGAVVVNTITNDITADIGSSSTVSAKTVLVSSTDTATVNGGAGQIAWADNWYKGTPAGAGGASVVVSGINNATTADIDSSTVTATSTIQVLANSDLTITVGAAGADGAETFVLGGSVVYNAVADTTQAYVSNCSGSPPDITAGGLTVSASDTSSISTGAGQVVWAGTAGYAAVGAAVVVDRISNTVTAYIGGSTVTADGDVSVSALSNESIEAIAIGVGGSVSDKKFGVDGVGSGAGNQVTDSTEAYISDSTIQGPNNSSGTPTGTGTVSVTAEDEAHITAIAGAVSIDVAKKGGASVAVGASAAYNLIGTSANNDPVWALIDDGSRVTAAGGVSLTATALPSISAYTLAGSGGGSGGDGASVGIFGAGAGSDNQIYTSVQAAIYKSSVTFTTSAGGVNESATDSSDITAVAGGASIGGAFDGSAGVAVTVGAALAINDIYDNTIAGIFASTVNSANGVSISAANN